MTEPEVIEDQKLRMTRSAKALLREKAQEHDLTMSELVETLLETGAYPAVKVAA